MKPKRTLGASGAQQCGQHRRHRLHESALERAVKDAVRGTGIAKPATCHTFRHSLCRLEDSHDIRTVQELLGHEDVSTTLVVELAERHRLPTVYEQRVFPDGGGLLSYGPGHLDRFQRAAVYVDRILRGAKPAELPLERPTKFELVINLRTAAARRLAIPQSVLLQADEVIK